MEASSAMAPRPTSVATLRAAGCVFAEEEARAARSRRRRTTTTWSDWSRAGSRASRWSRSSGGPSSAGCGSPWRPGCSCRGSGRRAWCAPRSTACGPGDVVVDLCCGTGAIGAALLAAVPGPRGARGRRRPGRGRLRPAQPAAGPGRTRATSTPRCPTDLRGRVGRWSSRTRRTSRPTRSRRCRPEARDHEHRVALDGGADGLDVAAPGHRRGAGLARARRAGAGRDERGARRPVSRGTDGGRRARRGRECDRRADLVSGTRTTVALVTHRGPRLHVVGPRVGDRRDRRRPDRHRPAAQRSAAAPAAVRREPGAPRPGTRTWS